MFDFIKGDDEGVKAEKRERNFIKDRDVFAAANSDDTNYVELQNQRNDLIRWQQEYKEELEELFHELKNETKDDSGKYTQRTYKEYDDKTKTWKIKEVPPLCNDWFIEEVKRQVKPFLNKNFINSNLTEAIIRSKLKQTHNQIVAIIADNWGKHGIQTTSDAASICRMIKNFVDPAAYRALDGWTKNKDSTVIKRIETSQDRGDEPKKGLMGLFSNG